MGAPPGFSGGGELQLSDEAATTREVTKVGVAATAAIGGVARTQIAFAPYVEQRFPFLHIDGALGLDFFRPYSVFANWDNQTYYLKPRGDVAATTTARLGRWGADVPACPHAGCVTAEVTATDTGATVHVVRDAQAAGHALEVFLAGVAGDGRAVAPLVAELPSSADEITSPVASAFAGATLTARRSPCSTCRRSRARVRRRAAASGSSAGRWHRRSRASRRLWSGWQRAINGSART